MGMLKISLFAPLSILLLAPVSEDMLFGSTCVTLDCNDGGARLKRGVCGEFSGSSALGAYATPPLIFTKAVDSAGEIFPAPLIWCVRGGSGVQNPR
jgi:hypothetical protein